MTLDSVSNGALQGASEANDHGIKQPHNGSVVLVFLALPMDIGQTIIISTPFPTWYGLFHSHTVFVVYHFLLLSSSHTPYLIVSIRLSQPSTFSFQPRA